MIKEWQYLSSVDSQLITCHYTVVMILRHKMDVHFIHQLSAHHTQFMEIGWRHLRHGHGAGRLSGNGTYISVTSPDSRHLTIVMETIVSSRLHPLTVQ